LFLYGPLRISAARAIGLRILDREGREIFERLRADR